MNSVSRRTALNLTLGTVAGLAGVLTTKHAQAAAEFTLKYANNSPINHPLTLRPQEAMEAIRAGDERQGRDPDVPEQPARLGHRRAGQLRSARIESFTLSPLILSILVPNASINGVGFAWPAYDKVWPAMDGDLGAFVRGRSRRRSLRLREDVGQRLPADHVLDEAHQVGAGPRGLQDPRPRVAALDLDVPGVRRRARRPSTSRRPIRRSRPRWSRARRTPWPSSTIGKLYEVQKNLSMTNHMWDGFWFLAEGRTWGEPVAEGGTDRHREALVNAAALREREDMFKLNKLETKLGTTGGGHVRAQARVPPPSGPSYGAPASTRNGRRSSARMSGSC